MPGTNRVRVIGWWASNGKGPKWLGSEMERDRNGKGPTWLASEMERFRNGKESKCHVPEKYNKYLTASLEISQRSKI